MHTYPHVVKKENRMTFIKTNWLSLLVIVLFIWVMFKPSGCGPSLPWEKGKNDTISVKSETVQVPQPIVIMPPYTPQQAGSTSYPIVIPSQYNPSQDIVKLTEQYNNLVKEFLASKNYKDSFQLKDSSGQRVGVVNLDQVVSENELKSTQPSYQLSFPHTTTTITLKDPPKNQLYIGAGITGNIATPVNGVTGGLVFKNKKDRLFGLSAGAQYYNGTFVPQFGLSTYWKISLKK